MPQSPAISYSDAGVNIDEANRAVARIKRLVRKTFSPNVLTGIGSFGAAYRLKGLKEPVLISSADGVGTKLMVAIMANRHNTIGEDLVNHCVNDIMVQGAEPLFFLDYFATGKLSAVVTAQVVEGIARGCERNGCALIGGETAEMPGLYADGEYDLAGFIVGAVERKQLLTGATIKPGDALLAFPSNGLHTNGYSLARKLMFETAGYKVDSVVAELKATVGEELLRVHRSYAPELRALKKAKLLKGAAHITGGGITENTPRMLPDGTAVEINTSSWTIPPVFELMRQIGNVPVDDYRRTFNLGVGMIVAVANAKKALSLTPGAWQIGHVVASKRKRVVYK
ncbi:MAG: phosphoribosylformylglycinamidine cyclo-ligase [Bryobacterales bacterium]|nr:phosphoribosylformylglycinamidine cyclo-ligase [Bryobacterales bacterium]